MVQLYRLWSSSHSSWCDYELDGQTTQKAVVRSLFPADWSGESTQIDRDFELIPEPEGPHGIWGTSVRADDRTLGYLTDEDGRAWAGVLRRIVASGLIPVTRGQIWGYESDWDEIEFEARVRVSLGEPAQAAPINDPPGSPYTMLPRSSIVQVTKEDQHTDALLKFVPADGYGVLFVTLHEQFPMRGAARPYVEVRIDDEPIGQLSPQMSQRFLPMIRHLQGRGLMTACWGDISGSPVAAEVRIDGVKSNEATAELLDGTPLTIPRLVPALSDPLHYDITPMESYLRPSKFIPEPPQVPAEPPDGSVLRFRKGRGYTYVAVRRGDHWETSATGDWGSINQVMQWRELTRRVRGFEIAAAWAPATDPGYSPHVTEDHAVTRFTIAGLYLAAVHITDDSGGQDAWYTTITDDLSARLRLPGILNWSDISKYGQYIQIVTEWAQLI
jgi:hypothetical protein